MSGARQSTAGVPRALLGTILSIVLYWTLVGKALACSPGAIDRKALARSDVIATGVIHIIERTERKSDGWTSFEGTAELRTSHELRNHTSLVAPFTFHFEFMTGEGCIFGLLPEDGDVATVYLNRSAPDSDTLTLTYLEAEKR